jgi:hypothetical protein
MTQITNLSGFKMTRLPQVHHPLYGIIPAIQKKIY